MEKRRARRIGWPYDRKRMAAQHPIDSEIRERLRKLAPKQIELAQRLGRSQGWLNKYINGAGHATIDDVIRIGAILIGVEALRLTEKEQRLLRAWRRLTADRQQDVVELVEVYAGRRRSRSGARVGGTARATNSKEPDTR
jgi:transcriptional regulator with XRE-family HTH domain